MAIHTSILPGKSHGQRNLVGYSPRITGVGRNLVTKPPPPHKMQTYTQYLGMTYTGILSTKNKQTNKNKTTKPQTRITIMYT